MFIRDLEYCQLEVSDNQSALVNGGGKTPSKIQRPSIPATASASVLVGALAQGKKLATTSIVSNTIAGTDSGLAISGTTLGVEVLAKG